MLVVGGTKVQGELQFKLRTTPQFGSMPRPNITSLHLQPSPTAFSSFTSNHHQIPDRRTLTISIYSQKDHISVLPGMVSPQCYLVNVTDFVWKCSSSKPPHHPYKMINAVLVFNNAGQPRLTKFYTQLVRPFTFPVAIMNLLTTIGNIRPATSHLRNFPSSLYSRSRILQLPPPPSPPLLRLNLTYALLQSIDTSQRCPLPRHLPSLRHVVFYNNQYKYRESAGIDRFNTSLCGGPGSVV